jgi:hypothetical protein
MQRTIMRQEVEMETWRVVGYAALTCSIRVEQAFTWADSWALWIMAQCIAVVGVFVNPVGSQAEEKIVKQGNDLAGRSHHIHHLHYIIYIYIYISLLKTKQH